MKYKILAVALGLGALGYVFREKVMAAVNALLDKVDAVVMVEDPSPGEGTEYGSEIPPEGEGYGIPGSRAYPNK